MRSLNLWIEFHRACWTCLSRTVTKRKNGTFTIAVQGMESRPKENGELSARNGRRPECVKVRRDQSINVSSQRYKLAIAYTPPRRIRTLLASAGRSLHSRPVKTRHSPIVDRDIIDSESRMCLLHPQDRKIYLM